MARGGGGGQELAVGIVRFIGEDAQYQQTRARVLATSEQLTTQVAAQAQRSTKAVTDSAGAMTGTIAEGGRRAKQAMEGVAEPIMRIGGASAPVALFTAEMEHMTIAQIAAARAATATGGAMEAVAPAVGKVTGAVRTASAAEGEWAAIQAKAAAARAEWLTQWAAHEAGVKGGTAAVKESTSAFSIAGQVSARLANQEKEYQAILRGSRDALKPLVSGHQEAGGAATEHMTRVRSLATALLHDVVPGMRMAGREVSMISREFGGASEGSMVFSVGLGLAAVAAGAYLGAMLEANKVTEDAAFAEATNDVAALDRAFKSAAEAIGTYETRVKLARHEVEGQNAVQGLLAFVMIGVDAIMGTTNAKIEEAIRLNTGHLGALANVITALSEEKALLGARAATIEVDKQRATSLTQLSALYQEQEANIKRVGEIDAQNAIRAARDAQQNIKTLMLQAHTVEEVASLKKRAQALEDEGQAKAAEIRATAAAKVAAAVRAEQAIRTAATLAELDMADKLGAQQARRAMGAATTAAALVESAHLAAAADAAFFNESERGFAEYQGQRRAAITETANLELAELERVYNAQRAALVVKAEAPESTLAERTAALNGLTVLEAKYAADREALSSKTRVALSADDRQLVTERRQRAQEAITIEEGKYAHLAALGQADYAGQLALLTRAGQSENLSTQQRMAYQEKAFAMYGQLVTKAAGYYDALASMGAVSAQKHIAFLDAQSQNERLSAEQRIGFAQRAFDAKLALEQAYVDRAMAMGTMTEADNVRHMAAMAQVYEAGSAKRIAAETQWATAVKSLQVSVAATGMSLADQAIASLQKRGAAMVSLNSIQQETERSMRAALATMATLEAGGSVTPEALANARAMGAAMADLTAKGQTASSALKVGFDLLANDLKGIPRTASGAADALGQMGVSGSQVGTQLGGMTKDILGELDKIKGAVGDVGGTFDALGTTAGENFTDGLTRGLEGSLGALDLFLTDADTKISSGVSKLADTVFSLFNSRLMAALDDERARS